ncbi:ROK family protein [Sphingomonas sp. 37zxx]|uniref:ROK family protein n=1 Tax=Sphingomonas sp. 37zxx TaxID=1550073 RepID=UPI00053BE2B6|nr:ROK family protein [Sphingomonas sp. 37zxx]
MSMVRQRPGLTRSDIIQALELSGPAVFRVSEELEARGFLTIGPSVAKGPGQPSASLRIVEDAVITAGLAVMTDTAQAIVMNLGGKLIAQANLPRRDMDPTRVVDDFALFVENAMSTHGLDRHRLGGVGVGLSGFFLEDGRISPPSELEAWADVVVGDIVSDRFERPVIVENIARAAAVGESFLGIGRLHRSFAYINLTAGLGGAVVLGGELSRGVRGNTGEIGALPGIIGCPKPSLTTLLEMLRVRGIALESIHDMVTRFDESWSGVTEWIVLTAPSIALIARAMRHVVDVDAVVLGGRLPISVSQRIVKAIDWPGEGEELRRGRPLPAPLLVAAELGNEAAAIGAAAAFQTSEYFM